MVGPTSGCNMTHVRYACMINLAIFAQCLFYAVYSPKLTVARNPFPWDAASALNWMNMFGPLNLILGTSVFPVTACQTGLFSEVPEKRANLLWIHKIENVLCLVFPMQTIGLFWMTMKNKRQPWQYPKPRKLFRHTKQNNLFIWKCVNPTGIYTNEKKTGYAPYHQWKEWHHRSPDPSPASLQQCDNRCW